MGLTNKEYRFKPEKVSHSVRSGNPNYKVCIIASSVTHFGNDKREGFTLMADLPETFSFSVATKYEPSISQGLYGLQDSFLNVKGVSGRTVANAFGMDLMAKSLTAQIWGGSSHISFQLPLIFNIESSPMEDVIIPLRQLMTLVLPYESSAGSLMQAPGPQFNWDKLTKNLTAATKQTIGSAGAIGSNALQGAGRATDVTTKNVVGSNVKVPFTNVNADQAGSAIANWGSSALQSVQKSGDGNAATAKSTTDLKQFPNAVRDSLDGQISLSIGRFQWFPSVVVTSVDPEFKMLTTEDGTPSQVQVSVSFSTMFVPTSQDINDIIGASSNTGPQQG
jgi:hypothetical protein